MKVERFSLRPLKIQRLIIKGEVNGEHSKTNRRGGEVLTRLARLGNIGFKTNQQRHRQQLSS